jgi:hypothetical protein
MVDGSWLRAGATVLRLTQPPLQVFLGEREAFNRLAGDKSIHNLGNVRDRDVAVKKVIRFD